MFPAYERESVAVWKDKNPPVYENVSGESSPILGSVM